jgi:hypothetical protein
VRRGTRGPASAQGAGDGEERADEEDEGQQGEELVDDVVARDGTRALERLAGGDRAGGQAHHAREPHQRPVLAPGRAPVGRDRDSADGRRDAIGGGDGFDRATTDVDDIIVGDDIEQSTVVAVELAPLATIQRTKRSP